MRYADTIPMIFIHRRRYVRERDAISLKVTCSPGAAPVTVPAGNLTLESQATVDPAERCSSTSPRSTTPRKHRSSGSTGVAPCDRGASGQQDYLRLALSTP